MFDIVKLTVYPPILKKNHVELNYFNYVDHFVQKKDVLH